jgi:phage terminase large subunit-like protein
MDKWIRNKSDEEAVKKGCFFDQKKADHICTFFESFLHLSTGKRGGSLIKLLDWQRDLLSRLNGWRNSDGTRRFRKCFVAISKKNGKSLLCSGLALYFAVADKENQPEVILGAYTREQAEIVYREAKNMVNKSPPLSKLINIVESKKKLEIRDKASSYVKVISSEANSAEGINASCVIIDELHAQKNRALFDALMYAGIARESPLFISITTAGFDPFSLCAEEWSYAKKVIDSELVDIELLPIIYSAQGMDFKSKEAWYAANPSLGHVLQERDFEAQLKRAMESPIEMNTFLRYRLNVWTTADERWILPEKWEACHNEDIKVEDLEGAECYGGLDLAATSDLCSFSLYFPETKSLLTWSWIPKETAIFKEKRNKTPYLKFEANGELYFTAEAKVPYSIIRAFIGDKAELYNIKAIAYDPWNAHELVHDLESDGMDMASMKQSYGTMSGPCKEFEGDVLTGELNHFNNELLSWSIGNVKVDSDHAGNIKPNKSKSSEKIDPVVASVMALGLSKISFDDSGPSVYESRGILSF